MGGYSGRFLSQRPRAAILETCLDEEAWSANRYHIERDEVAHALAQIDQGDLPIVVMGHSRGGAMAMLGAQQHVLQGGRMDGISLWAPVADLVSRLPKGAALEAWKSSNRLEVLNGRTGQTLVHPFAFYTDTMQRAEELSVERAAKATPCPTLVIHGTLDPAVHLSEEARLRMGAQRFIRADCRCRSRLWHASPLA